MRTKKTNNRLCLYLFRALGMCLCLTLLLDCKQQGDNGQKIFFDNIGLDSLDTEKQLDNILNGGYISMDNCNRYRYPELVKRDDIRYLPYLYLILNEQYLPKQVEQKYLDMIYMICGNSDNNSLLSIGNKCFDVASKKLNNITWSGNDTHKYEANNKQKEWNRKYTPNLKLIDGKSIDIDSLRIRVIWNNDRNALSILEKYYKDINFEKELAVYYKIMLCYEGNGELAERYYNVLKPYLVEQPEFFNSIREVLLRAALCDGNQRAQEICDSLCISLYDYRLQYYK